MSWWGDAWDGATGFVGEVGKKTGSTLENVAQVASIPVGLAFDAVRYATPLDNHAGPDWLSTTGSLGAAGDLLTGENTLTGWTVNTVGSGLDAAYRYGIEDNLEAIYYKNANKHFNPITGKFEGSLSWSDAYDLARDRNLGDAVSLASDEALKDFGNATGFNLGGWIGDITSSSPDDVVDSGILSAARDAGFAQDADEIEGRSGFIGDTDNPYINPVDSDAVKKLHEQSPFWAGFISTGVDLTAMFALDPALIALKATKGARELRSLRPILGGEESDLSSLMATEESHKVLGVNSKRAGLKSRTDPLIGTVKYEDAVDDAGLPLYDEDGTIIQSAVQDVSGWLDGKTEAQTFVGLNLKSHPYGPEIATVLSRTNTISDPAMKVEVRRDLLAAMGGDMEALNRLGRLHESGGKEYATALSNMFRGRGSGELDFAVADEARALETGSNISTKTDPDVVAGIRAEGEAQEGFDSWLYASMKERTFRVSAKANRAVARLDRKGLGRDGTLNTGWTGLDRVINEKALGKFKPNGSVLDKAIDESDELAGVEPTGLAGGKIYDADNVSWSRGASQMGFTLVKGGLAVAKAGTSAWLKAPWTASDALRGRVVQGLLDVEDQNLSASVTFEFLRRAGINAEDIDRHVSNVLRAENPVGVATAVQRAQDDAIKAIAQRHGVDRDTVLKVAAIHKERQEATMSAIRGQVYSAHTKKTPTGEVGGDVVFLPDDGGTLAVPIWDTTTVNNMPLVDLVHADKWLARDRTFADASQMIRNFRNGGNEQARAATAMGFNSRVNAKLEAASDKLIRYYAEETNGWWKRAVLLSRAPSYAIRNTTEEMMRVWAAGYTAQVADAAMRQAGHDLRDWTRRKTGSSKVFPSVAQEYSPIFATLNLRKNELDDLIEEANNAGILEASEKVRSHIRSLQSKKGHANRKGDAKKVAELEAAIADFKLSPALLEPKQLDEQIKALQGEIQDLEKALETKQLPDSGMHTVLGIEMPDAFAGVRGRQSYDLIAQSGTFDRELSHLNERAYARRKGIANQDVLTVANPKMAEDEVYVARHLHAWAWAINGQIRQDVAGQVAIKAIAEGVNKDEVTKRLFDWLSSDAAESYRRANPHRAHDVEEWAQDMSDMARHYIPKQGLAHALLKGDVDPDDLADAYKNVSARPDVHSSGVDITFGYQSKTLAQRSSNGFKRIDRMSVNRFTRHPMFAAVYRGEQERLAGDYLRKVVAEQGEGATLTVDDVNRIAERAHKVARKKVRETFYDTSSRSTAAQQLRFMFPFFAAHQNSMEFWGRTLVNNPAALRGIQLTFEVPYALGLVTDMEGNVLERGTFPQSDHVMYLQLPKALGGSDLSDPHAKRSRWSLNPTSFNLIMQNGGILNPGAGPMTAIPVGVLQRKLGGSSEELSKIMEYFSPFGAPKDEDNIPFVPDWMEPALPTPVKRLGALLGGEESLQMYNLRIQEAQVEFMKEHDRPPNTTEALEMDKRVASEVRWMGGLRFAASLVSPSQPRPASAYQGFIDEYRRLQDQGESLGQGPMWATDEFVNRYGPEYFALTRSASMNRARLRGTPGEVSALRANSGLADVTTPQTWRAIIGAEGKGEFNTDAYRWMQSKKVGRDGETLIDRKAAIEQITDTNIQMGWREYNKYQDMLQVAATQNGLTTYAQSPGLTALKKQIDAMLADKYRDWNASRVGSNDFESEYLPSLERIASNKKLLNDPGRQDIQVLRQYLTGREAIVQLLRQRGQMPEGSDSIEAKSNQDLMYAWGIFSSQLAESNTDFSSYILSGIVDRDPYYRQAMEVVEAANG